MMHADFERKKSIDLQASNAFSITHKIIKVLVFSKVSLSLYCTSASRAFVIAIPDTILNTLATESMQAFWYNMCVTHMV